MTDEKIIGNFSYKGLLDAIPEGVLVIDRNGIIIYVSRCAFAIYGYESAEELSGKSVYDLISDEDRDLVRVNFSNFVQNLTVSQNIYSFIQKNGSLFKGELSANQLIDNNGSVIGVIVIVRDISERVEGEIDIRESEEKYRLLAENMRDIIWKLSADYRFTYVSPSDKIIRGFEPEEVLGKTIFEIITPETLGPISKKIKERQEKLNKGEKLESTTFEAEMICKDGSVIWIEIMSNPVYDINGQLAGFQGVSREIADRKRMETIVKENDELYRTAVSNAPIVLFQIDSDGIFRLSEGKGLKKLGLKPGQVVGVSAFEVYKDFPDICQQIRDALTGKTVKEIININDIIFEIIYNPIVNRKGKVISIIGIAIDISDNYKAQQALIDSEVRFRTLFESMSEGVALHELIFNEKNEPVNYRILEVNPAYEKHTGIKNTNSRNILATDLYGTEIPPYFPEFSKVAITGESYNYETYFPPLERYFRISVISPGKNMFATVFEDITNQKSRERELKEKNVELERFTYTVSHDLKSPLVTIKGFIGMLEQDINLGDTENMRDDFKRIKSAADKMGDLLNDLLELSRIGRVMNPPTVVSMAQIVNETMEFLTGIIQQSNTHIVISCEMPKVRVDKQRFSQVWQNLIENAIKFMFGQPQPLIEIGCYQHFNEHIFYIKDNGIGIEPEYHDTIFGLFNKLENKTEGTGIGLALVKRIIEVHSGRIWVESQGKEMGATFKFTLPIYNN